MTECKVLVKPFMVKKEENPLPMRTMFGTIERETKKAYYMKLHCKPEASTRCLHCNRKLSHPVSLLYGLGPICGNHFHINPFSSEEELDSAYNDLVESLQNITWSGWIPKSQIMELENRSQEIKAEPKFEVLFKFNGETYKSLVSQMKLSKIEKNAEIIELTQVV